MRNEGGALFESSRAFAASTLLALLSVWLYRCMYLFCPSFLLTSTLNDHRIHNHGLVWIGMIAAEVWFGLYWILTQAARWNPIYRRTFKDNLTNRHEKELPGVDIFVCTANPTIEPPIMVINTVLSVMAYDYPSQKVSVYLSDDGGSDITFYALILGSTFDKHWIPYCKKFKVESPCPAAYFSTSVPPPAGSEEWASIRESYEEMKNRIQSVTDLGGISEELRLEHNEFTQWESFSSPHNNESKKENWTKCNDHRYFQENAYDLEERLKDLASCTFEKDTEWGNEVGLKYGCAVEDVITGLSIKYNGWKSVYYKPERKGFLGVAPTSLYPTLVQHKRWSGGDLQILLSKYSPDSSIIWFWKD
ncbi:cellulose synthase-like protein E6 [Heracleum sosnowskyi]|uniref:Cellulose synthase-like protein E6 n=1 Tax=Heracleum sosnowskyi TaxID=360622 RepID=A0AAD8IWD3_9APIA|nr:cellulose synthase-like protein E6 [Heracleum sosnowskyi]